MVEIVSSVGKGGMNLPMDVMTVETLLSNHRGWLVPLPHLTPDSRRTPETNTAISLFQERACALAKDKITGKVSPGCFTFKRLSTGYIPKPTSVAFSQWGKDRSADVFLPADFVQAAASLDCEVEVIQAVVEQEAGIRGPWDENGRPTILYERHKFSGHTKAVWDVTHPDISNPKWGGYGKFREQYAKLYRAATLNEDAALKSASWGAFQILGENHVQTGHATLASFIDAMVNNVQAQLTAFVAFVNNDRRLKKALKDKDWTTFARIYNGPDYKKNNYDTAMATIYRRLTAHKTPPPKPGK